MKCSLIFMVCIVASVAAAESNSDADAVEAPPVKSQLMGSGVGLSLTEAIQLIDDRDYRAAVKKLKLLSKSHENNSEVWRLLGVASFKKGDFLGSKIAFEKSLEIDSENSQTLSEQAVLFMSIGDRESARSNLYKLDAICPDGCEARDQVASSLDLL